MGHLEIGQLLLSHGADVNFRDYTGWTPLYCAALYGQLKFARMLLEHGAEIDVGDEETPLFVASKYGYVDVVRLLLEYGANLSAYHELGISPSLVASMNGHQQIVQLLSGY